MNAGKQGGHRKMNKELLEALNLLEKEKDINKDTLLEAIENSLLQACKGHFGRIDNIHVHMDRETCDYELYAEKEVVETVEDPLTQISTGQRASSECEIQHWRCGKGGDQIKRIRPYRDLQCKKNVILQKIREEERKVLFEQYYAKEKDIVTGVVQRYFGRNLSINLGKVDAILSENEQVRGEHFEPTERIKVYVLEVKDTTKGPRIRGVQNPSGSW